MKYKCLQFFLSPESGQAANGRRRRQGPPARFPDLEKIGDIYVCQNNFHVLLMCYTAFLRVTKTDTQRDDRYPAPLFLIGSFTATLGSSPVRFISNEI